VNNQPSPPTPPPTPPPPPHTNHHTPPTPTSFRLPTAPPGRPGNAAFSVLGVKAVYEDSAGGGGLVGGRAGVFFF